MQTILKSLYWILLQELSIKLVSFATSLVLLWYLSPTQFGSFFFVWLFFSAFAVWRNGGTQETIILFGKNNPEQWQTHFWQIQLKSAYALILLVGLLIFDDFIFGYSISCSLWVAMALIFIFEGLYIVPLYIGEVQKDFKIIFRWHLLAECMASFTGIVLASKGQGVYALCAKMIVSACIKTVSMWGSFYFPLRKFSSNISKAENKFGNPLSYTKLLNFIARNIDDFMIGRYLGDAVLGLYNRVYNISLYPFLQLGSAVNRALLPEAETLVKNGDAALFLKLFSFNLYVYSMSALALYWWGPTIVLHYLPEMWHSAASLFQIFAGILFLQGLSRPNSVFFTLSGDTALELKLNVILKIFTIICLSTGIFLFKNINMVVWCYLISVVVSAMLQWAFLTRLLGLPLRWWESAFWHTAFIAFFWIIFQNGFILTPFPTGFLLIGLVIFKLVFFDKHLVSNWKSFLKN